MSAKRIVLVVGRIFQGLHAKNRQTLAVLMAALLVTGRAGVAALGRGIQSRTAFKHSIKRVDRFLGNDNVVVCDWCKALFATVVGPRKSVKIAIDWTKIGPWPVLVASVVIRRRGIPIYWATCDFRKLQRSQNAFENSFLVVLRDIIPRNVNAILLFDRGFRRVSLVKHIKSLGFHFVIRSCSDAHIMTAAGDKIALRGLMLSSGIVKDFGHVMATMDKPEDVRLVAVFDRDQKEPWLLFSDLDLPARDIVALYGRRFTIEEFFRDSKNSRFGWSLGQYKLKNRPDRLDRLFLVVVATYFLVSIIGLHLEHIRLDAKFKANTSKQKTHSIFQLGWKGRNLVRWLPQSWFARFDRLDFDCIHLEARHA